MRDYGRRRARWSLAATAAIVMAITFHVANALPDPAPALVTGLAIEIVIAIAAIMTGRRDEWPEGLHADGRWTALSAMRTLAVGSAILFLAAAGAFIVLGLAMPIALPSVLLVTTAACIVGACLERRPKPRPQARTVYRTRGGEVKRVANGAKRDYVLTDGATTRRLSDVEREIDRRGWTETASPAPESLRAALERWGQLETR